jgi:hypothetical protein
MWKLLQYYGKYQNARGVLGGMPFWARLLLLIAAAPGLTLIALSIAALCVSILALLLLTVPVYRLLKLLTGAGSNGPQVTVESAVEGEPPPLASVDFVEPAEPPAPSTEVRQDSSSMPEPTTVELEPKPPRRPIEVRIIE